LQVTPVIEDDEAGAAMSNVYGTSGQKPCLERQPLFQPGCWYNLAALCFSALEGVERKNAVHNRDLVAAKTTPSWIAGAQRLAHEWKPKKGRKSGERSNWQLVWVNH